MFGKKEVGTPQRYVADTLLKSPSLSESVFDNLAEGYISPAVGDAAAISSAVNKTFASTPQGKSLFTTYNALQLTNERPQGTAQQYAGMAANMIGWSLSPQNWFLFGAAGKAVGAAADLVGAGASRVLPEAASTLARTPIRDFVPESVKKYIPETIGGEAESQPLNISNVAKSSAKTFGSWAATSVPTEIAENYNQQTGHINYPQVMANSAKMGGLGLVIHSVVFAAGVILGKANRALGHPPSSTLSPDDLDSLVKDKIITPEEHQWYKDWDEHQSSKPDLDKAKELEQRATDIVAKSGQPVNTVSHEVPFDILREQDMHNLKAAVADEVASGRTEDHQRALSDFVVNGRLDAIRENPGMLDGVRGYVDAVEGKLRLKADKLAYADQILDEHMLKGMHDEMPLSHESIAEHGESPLVVPKGKILSPTEELKSLRKKLLDKGLPKDFKTSPEYHRLLDLSHVWANAHTLLDRVHLEDEYNRQEAFKNVAKEILRINDSGTGRLAKPDNVMNYLKDRIEQHLQKIKSLSQIKEDLKEADTLPADAEQILNEQKSQFSKTSAREVAEEFNDSTFKFKEFKASENIFKNFINCVVGALNG